MLLIGEYYETAFSKKQAPRRAIANRRQVGTTCATVPAYWRSAP